MGVPVPGDLGINKPYMANTEQIDKVREKIGGELSQLSSSLLAWRSWGTVAPDKIHELKETSTDEIKSLIQPLIDQARQEVAEKIFEELETSSTRYICDDEWVKIKSHYLGNKGGRE